MSSSAGAGAKTEHRSAPKRSAITYATVCVPGEQIWNLWYVDWTAFNRSDGNDLVAMALKGAA